MNDNITAVERIQHYLNVIEQKNQKINAFVEVYREEALEAARQSDQRRAVGKRLSPLDGIPFGIKDNFAYQHHLQTCASQILQGYRSPYSASVVDRLINAGMIPLGRLNMDEFAMGSGTTFSCYGATHNPYDVNRTAGGSSGGSAAAVAAGMVPCALGSDTGGSIRQPASYCGVVGLKPAYGALSRYGLTAFASSLDHVGWLCENVELLWRIMHLFQGGNGQDATCDAALLENLSAEPESLSLNGLRVGFWEETTLRNMEPAVQKVWRGTLDQLADAGARLIPLIFSDIERSGAAYAVISSAEASSNLSRFDGIRYGARASNCKTINDTYVQTRTKGFGAEVQRRLLLGAAALANGGKDYADAMHIREQIRKELYRQLSQCDVLITPSTPCTAPLLSQCEESITNFVYSSNAYVLPQSLAGYPCISIPCGMADGLPVGLCLTALPSEMNRLMGAALSLQELRRPCKQ